MMTRTQQLLITIGIIFISSSSAYAALCYDPVNHVNYVCNNASYTGSTTAVGGAYYNGGHGAYGAYGAGHRGYGYGAANRGAGHHHTGANRVNRGNHGGHHGHGGHRR